MSLRSLNQHDTKQPPLRGILDFSQIEDSLTVKITAKTASHYNNKLALVRLDPNRKRKNYSIQGIKQHEDGFLDTLRANLIKLKGKSFNNIRQSNKKTIVEWNLSENDAGLYAPVLITENKDLLTFGDTTASDGLQHLKVFGDNQFGFEDELASDNPDWDFNDHRIKFSII